MRINPLILAQSREQKRWQQGRRNAAKERPLTSSLKWPHESGHQAVGGVDSSSARHHLTPVAVYLAWSLADTNWCRHLFALRFLIFSLSLSPSPCLTSSLCRFLHGLLHNVSLLDLLHLTINNMISRSGLCVFSFCTLPFSVSLSASLSDSFLHRLASSFSFCCVSLSMSAFTRTNLDFLKSEVI